jgi:hypothetical protein
MAPVVAVTTSPQNRTPSSKATTAVSASFSRSCNSRAASAARSSARFPGGPIRHRAGLSFGVPDHRSGPPGAAVRFALGEHDPRSRARVGGHLALPEADNGPPEVPCGSGGGLVALQGPLDPRGPQLGVGCSERPAAPCLGQPCQKSHRRNTAIRCRGSTRSGVQAGASRRCSRNRGVCRPPPPPPRPVPPWIVGPPV